MPRIMQSFKLAEISAVDRPAQIPARMVIMKRDGEYKGETEMTRNEQLAALAKDFGVIKIAKCIVENGNGPGAQALTEVEFTKLVHDYAQLDRRAGESAEQAFARCFTANTDEGLAIRKAHAVVKSGFGGFPLATNVPVSVGGAAATAVDDPKDALSQLQRLAEEQRRRSPHLSIEQAFALIYAAPENAKLAAQERAQNRPQGRVATGV